MQCSQYNLISFSEKPSNVIVGGFYFIKISHFISENYTDSQPNNLENTSGEKNKLKITIFLFRSTLNINVV